MERESIDTILKRNHAQSKHSDAEDIDKAEIILVSDSLCAEAYLDIIYTQDYDPIHHMPLRLEGEYKDKKIFQQIDSAIGRPDIKKVFAYIPRRSFDHIAKSYVKNDYHLIYGITAKNE